MAGQLQFAAAAELREFGGELMAVAVRGEIDDGPGAAKGASYC